MPIHEVAVPREEYLRLWPVCIWYLDSPAHHPSEPAPLSVARTCRADGIKVLGTERILLDGLLADQLQWSRATTEFIVDDLRHDIDLRFLMVGTEIWLRQQFGSETSDAIDERLLAHAR